MIGSNIRLQQMAMADSCVIQHELSHWETLRYLSAGMPWPFPPDGARRMLETVTFPAVARGEEWAWTIRTRRDPDQVIGAISLLKRPDDNRGFWISRSFRSQGLMTEACRLVTDYWFNTLGFPVMRVPKALANTASIRISVKEGMRLVRFEDREFVSGRLPAGIWEITRDEWNDRHGIGGFAHPDQRMAGIRAAPPVLG